MLRNKKRIFKFWPIALLLAIGILYLYSNSVNDSQKINYSTQVKPILNKRCLPCHGGVKQNGGFSLITRDLALRKNESGKAAIIPGNPDDSEMIRRILSEDPELRMPHEAAPLPEAEIKLLKAWIKEGAKWGKHWAYSPLKPGEIKVPSTPDVVLSSLNQQELKTWAKNDVDHFILEKLQKLALSPNPEAEKATLLRRLSLDLIGLPAPESLAHSFLRKENPISYDRLVDSLLASPHFGERWASMWLDLARYADSKGYERDPNRNIWAYRDYVIRAFNKDTPYDQFLMEQIAGDLLPNPTDEQYLATGFHRNTTTNDEGGTDNEEYRVMAVIDRVNTTWEAILGTTFSCVQCHGHPYDPFFHDDYYEFMAFFNNTRDNDTHKDYPLLRLFSEAEMEQLNALTTWIGQEEPPAKVDAIKTFLKTWQPSIYSIELDSFINSELYDTKYLGFRQDGWARLKQVNLSGKNQMILKAKTTLPGGKFTIHLDYPGGPVLTTINLPFTERKDQFFELPLTPTQGVHHLFFHHQNPQMEDANQMGFQIDWVHFGNAFPGENRDGYAEKKASFWTLMEASPPTSLIMMENPEDWRRKTHRFDRGNFLVPLEEVHPEVPAIFPPLPEQAPKNRLGLAQWLTAPENPLTSRTIVNRIWEQIFGLGLAETLEDLGSQGIPPTHPELLDWLAGQFIHDHQWSLKSLLKEIVSSASYRQSPEITPEALEADPYNAYLSRGPRVRLSAEQVRDQALAISGLLNPEKFGPPVMPYQPEGLWQAPYSNEKWKIAKGDQAYRRAIYTYLKRSFPYPSFETFDVAPRTVCVARRIRTNTPLQALVTLNDPVYLEAAQHFAIRMQKGGKNEVEWIKTGYKIAIGKTIDEADLRVFQDLYQDSKEKFSEDQVAAQNMIDKINPVDNSIETAALVVVANSMMNLDAFLTK